MTCARQGCSCPMGESKYEADGAVYCCEKCAKICSDGNCVCSPGDCGA